MIFNLRYVVAQKSDEVRNICYIEKNFSVYRDENVIDAVRNRVAVYEDSVRRHHEMVELSAYKDSVASVLKKEVEEIKKIIR